MQFFLTVGLRQLIKFVKETVTNFLSEASVVSLNKCYKKILTGDVS